MQKYLSKSLKKTFSICRAKKEENIINPSIKMIRILTENNPGKLFQILKKLKKFEIDASNLESDYLSDKNNCVIFDIFYKSQNPISLKDIQKALKSENCQIQTLPPTKVPDFPIKIQDLDKEIKLLELEENLNQDHPGYKDREYRERRDFIAENAGNYKMLHPIPRIKYTEKENEQWKILFTKLKPMIYDHACKEFVENFKLLEKERLYLADKIPQLEDISNYTISKNNWRIKPVNGILSQRQYLNFLAFRTFSSTQYLRHFSKPFFTPEPDIFHEFLGHIPMFCDSTFCNISQKLGIMSLGASDQLVKLIGSVYWFTVEFGMCFEEGERKFYGAGIASSVKEMKNFLKCEDIRKLDIEKSYPPTEYVVQDVQPFYYYIEEFEEYFVQLERMAEKYKKPFKYCFDKNSEFLYIDRKLETFPEEIEQN